MENKEMKQDTKQDTNLNDIMEATIKGVGSGMPPQQAAAQAQAVYNYVENPARQYFQSGRWHTDRAFFKQNNVMSGFSNMDSFQPLYPGLYAIGAIPSLGKTTLMHALCDSVAASKHHVLFFSYEQASSELYSKSLARRIHQHAVKNPSDNYNEYTAIQIRSCQADGTRELAEQTDAYLNDVEDYMEIIDCNFDCPVEILVAIVEKKIKAGIKPVVVIDYLQVIHTSYMNGRVISDQRTSVDHIIKTLKQMQKQYSLVVIVISNLNRMNYLLPVDFESFKESGGIEYTCDLIYGMSLTITSDPDFEYKVMNAKKGTLKETTLREKRLMVGQAKGADIRDIEVKILKNRFGPVNKSFYFEYNPKYDTFVESSYDRYEKRKRKGGYIQYEDDDNQSEEYLREKAEEEADIARQEEASRKAIERREAMIRNQYKNNGPDVNDFMIRSLTKKDE